MSKLIIEISKLSVTDRILLIQEILSTISLEVKEKKDNLSVIQLKEIKSRSASIKNGKAKTKPWDKIETALTERYEL